MQSVAKHLARFVAYTLITAAREMLRYALHDRRFYYLKNGPVLS